jgi:hypothetical protein
VTLTTEEQAHGYLLRVLCAHVDADCLLVLQHFDMPLQLQLHLLGFARSASCLALSSRRRPRTARKDVHGARVDTHART